MLHHPAVAGQSDRLRLRTTFEEIPELYDRARPLYPEPIFDDLAALARLPEAARSRRGSRRALRR